MRSRAPFLLPPSVDEWLPEDHLARFVVDIIEQLDLAALTRQYRGSGSAAYHPQMLLALLVYGYATGTFRSRRLEQATCDSLAFRYIAANTHPDHDTLCASRKRFLPEIERLFVQVLRIAKQMKLLKLGTIALDGTKLHANASRHSALSHGHASARAQTEQAEYDAKLKARAAREEDTGKPPRGRPPTPPSATPGPQDQVNLTDPDSRIMLVASGGFEQCYNAQAAVDTDSMLVVATTLTQAANDKQQVVPMLAALATLPQALGTPETLIADNGYFSQANVGACVAAGVEPLLAAAREPHHLSWQTRVSEPAPLPAAADAVRRMRHTLATRQGRTRYGLRKQTVEPVFGIIKPVLGFRQFLLRGAAAVRGEWSLVTMAWNIRRMAVLSG
jgi:transposase